MRIRQEGEGGIKEMQGTGHMRGVSAPILLDSAPLKAPIHIVMRCINSRYYLLTYLLNCKCNICLW